MLKLKTDLLLLVKTTEEVNNQSVKEEIEFINVNHTSAIVKEEPVSEDFNVDDLALTDYEIEMIPNYCSICNSIKISTAVTDFENRPTANFTLYCDYCYEVDLKKYMLVWQEKIDNEIRECNCSAKIIIRNKRQLKCFKYFRFMWCRKCNIIFDQDKYVMLDCKTCNGQRRSFFCYHCLASFNYLDNFRNLYQCNKCFKSFSCKTSLKIHKLIHLKRKENTCNICSKSFIYPHLLKYHLETHSGERPYSCHVCSSSFCRKTTLASHLKIHSGEKRYSCNVCSKKFTFLTSLKRHFVMHLGKKPHSCDICSKSFTQISSLKYHLKSHSGEKPYSCDLCLKSFCRKSNLKSHMKIH